MLYIAISYSALFRHRPRIIPRSLALLISLLLVIEPGTLACAPSLRLNAQAGAGSQAAAQEKSDAPQLKLGEPVERALAGGQSHTYQITLAEGQYLNVVVEQRGIDVVVRLSGPDGKLTFEFDDEIRNQGQEMVSQAAELAGSYRLTVQAKRKEAPAGRYEIRMVELRVATEKDRALQEARKLHAESLRLYRAGKYGEALPLAERALGLREKELGLEHPDVALTLRILATLHFDKGDYAKAEPLFQRVLDIREKVFGPHHPEVARALSNLASLYIDKGDYAKAEPLSQRALAVREKALGPEHPDFAAALTSLAILYSNKGDYAQAGPLFQRALDIREKVFGPRHPEVARALTNLAALHLERGNNAKAEPLFLRAQEILEQTLGPDHPELVTFLNNLSTFYRRKGDYAKAETLLLRTQAILEKTFKQDHPAVADALTELAALYRAKGDYAKAEPLYQSALAIREKVFGPDHSEVAHVLNNLGDFYADKGDHTKAEPLLQSARAIFEKTHGPEHPVVARALSNLATLYLDKGDYARAEPLLITARDIWMKKFGLEHHNVALALTNLALIHHTKGDYAKAEPLYQSALTIREKVLWPEDSAVARSLSYLARLYCAKGELAQAVTFQSRASAISERNIALHLVTSSERQKLAYLATLSGQTDQTISLHVRYAPNDPTARNLAATTILQRKGRVLDSMFDSFGALRRRLNAQDQALLDQLKETSEYLAKLVLGGPQKMPLGDHRKQIKALEEQKEKYEADVSRHSDGFPLQSQPVTIEAVQSAIPVNAAIVEFFSYRPFNAKFSKPDEVFGQPYYVAYVLRRQGEPQWVELGEAKVIDEAVAGWRKALRDPKRADAKRLARQVDEQVMRPVRALLGDTRRVFISPDGALNLIPFAALVDEQDRYLVERYSFSYLTSGRDLLRLQAPLPGKPELVIVADPVFGERADASPAQKRDVELHPDAQPPTTQSSILSQLYFPRLPGTAGEAQALKTILPQATALTREQATEAALKRLSSPRILHIATHGFFLEDIESRRANTRDVVLLGDSPAGLSGALPENPLLRSGLALTGANLRKSGPNQEDDGVLTAMEVTGLDLWGTKLVVLSACDTGVGEVKTGEGVYGLRRALVLAGSETQVMSLWPVSDEGTRELMIAYYKALQRGEGRGEALRQVQLRMLKRKGRQHPFYWASFIQSGEWANLEGKR